MSEARENTEHTVETQSGENGSVDRRTIMKSAAWSTPIIALAVAAPQASASTTPCQTALAATLVQVEDVKYFKDYAIVTFKFPVINTTGRQEEHNLSFTGSGIVYANVYLASDTKRKTSIKKATTQSKQSIDVVVVAKIHRKACVTITVKSKNCTSTYFFDGGKWDW